MWTFTRRLIGWIWRQRFRLPLTALGTVVVAAAILVYRYLGSEQMDFVLHAGALSALALVLLAVVMVLLVTGLLWLRLGRSGGVEDLELESGVRSATGFSFPRFRGWPLVQVRMEWAHPPRVEATMERSVGRVQEVVEPRQRCDVMFVLRRFVVADIFGLSRLGLHRRTEQRVRVSPGRARASGHVIAHFVGGEGLSHPAGPPEGELLDMRRYGYGDPLRNLLWKVYARTRQLVVRTQERAISPSPSAIAYFVAGEEDEPSASVARFFLEEGLLGGDFQFEADGAADPTSDRGEAIDQLIKSVDFRRQGATGLGRFLRRTAERRRRSCVLFVPPVGGDWLGRVEQLADRLGGATAVIGIDDEVQPEQRGQLQRLLFAGPGRSRRAQRGARALPEVVSRLSRAGLSVKVLHRPSGELVATEALLSRARAEAPSRRRRRSRAGGKRTTREGASA